MAKMILLDSNLLIYAYEPESPHHEDARIWFEGVLNGPAKVGFGQYEGGPTRSFHPFTVGGHQESEVSLAIPMHCTANSETVELSRVLVSTSFFGQSHQTWVNIAPFNIVFAKSC